MARVTQAIGSADIPRAGKAEPGASRRARRSAVGYLLEIVQLAHGQTPGVVMFTAISLGSSMLHLGGLACLSAVFSLSGQGAEEIDSFVAWLLPLMQAMGVDRAHSWLAFFILFLLLTLVAVGFTHLSWIVRLRLLSRFEAELMFRGLNTINGIDPRDRAGLSRREMLLAVRGDCKSTRVVFQLLLLSAMSLMIISLPLWYALRIDPGMMVIGLSIALLGFVPVYFISRRAARMSLERQEVAMNAGSRVSGLLVALETTDLSDREVAGLIDEVRTAVSRQHILWRQQYEMRSLCQQIPISFSLLGSLGILLFGIAKLSAETMAIGELLTILVASRVVFAPVAQVSTRWVKTAEHIPRAMRHLDFVQEYSPAATTKVHWIERGMGEHPRISEVRVTDLAFPVEGEQTEQRLSLKLVPGSILCIADPEADYDNPLLQWIAGERYVPQGAVLFDGVDINGVRYDAVGEVVGYPPRQYAHSGTVLECVRELHPDATAEEVEAFGRRIFRDRYDELLPEGLDCHMTPEAKKTDDVVRGCYYLHELFDLSRSGKAVLLVDFFSMGNPGRRSAMIRFCQTMRDSFITVWIDTAPRPELGPQTVVAFREKRFLGIGDLAWFKKTFPDWDYDVPPRVAAKSAGGLDEGTIEAIEDESLIEG